VGVLLDPPRPLDDLPRPSCDLGGLVVGGEGGRTVSVRGGAIVEIREARPGEDRRFEGCVLAPGLIDSHQHLPPASPLKLTGLFCLLNLLHGVTSVLEAGDGDGMAVANARRLMVEGVLPGPRVVSVGPFIARPPRQWPNSILVGDPVNPAVVVQAAIDRGAQMIKLYEELTRSDIAALVSAARERGLRAIGHVPASLDVEDAGVPEVQHLFGVPTAQSRGYAPGLLERLADWRAVDDARLDAVVEASVAKRISHTPTLVVTEGVLKAQEHKPTAPLLPRLFRDVIWSPARGIATYRGATPQAIAMLRDSLPIKLGLIRRLHEAGVQLYAGTDVPQPFVVPGESLQRELRLFVEAGIPAAAVMKMATVDAGRRLGVPDLGKIAVGAPADLLVLERDPSVDIAALGTLRAVIVGGRLLETSALRAAVERQLRHYRRALVDRASIIGARRALDSVTVRP
jgi:hypothetical protein